MTASVKARDLVHNAVDAECDEAIAIYGNYHSPNEGWAILQEEVEEVIEAAGDFKHCSREIMSLLWQKVRHNDIRTIEALELLDELDSLAFELAMECVQVSAVCKKWRRTIEGNNDEEWEKVGDSSGVCRQ